MIPTPHTSHAGILIRAFAITIDALILLPISGLLHSLFADQVDLQALSNLIISGAYYVMFISGPWQATPGKRIAGVFVVNVDGSKLSQRQALQRYIGYIIPSLPVYSSIDINVSPIMMLWLSIMWFLPIALTEQRTGVHDLLCRTRVLHGRVEN